LVVVGVIAELAIAAWHPPYDSFWEQWGSSVANGLIAIGVAFEIKFGQMAGLRQSELRRRSEEKVAEANLRAATALEGAKRAYQTAKENAEPRQIKPKEFNGYIEMAQPAKAEILYVRDCADCLWLAFGIMATLKGAKWEIVKYGPLEQPTGDKAHLSAAVAAGAAVQGGVTMLGKPPLDWVDFKKPFAALHAALVCGGVGGDPALNCMADDKLPEGLIRIIVAPRP